MAHEYLCIDLKSFYASVECADRGLDPFTTDLVVADPERSANTICLAVTPSMKAKGVRSRCRLRDIPAGMEYLVAVPRMRRYMEASAEVYRIYLEFASAEDAWPYSIDECFIDAAPYARAYRAGARELARALMDEVRRRTGISATAGIGPNMFLCKVALDVMAKHADDGIGELDGESFRREIWFHRPITDIWGIGPGTARRLASRGIRDLAGVCAVRPEAIRRMLGRNGEVLVDHAWGIEPCTIADCRAYAPKARSLSNGQVLMRDYAAGEARTVVREMVFALCVDLAARGLSCGGVSLWVGYSGGAFSQGSPPPAPHAGGQRSLGRRTSSERIVSEAVMGLFDETVAPGAPIRRLGVALLDVAPGRCEAPTLFDGAERMEREARAAEAAAAVRGRFGANALLKARSLMPGANARERNLQVGGHRA